MSERNLDRIALALERLATAAEERNKMHQQALTIESEMAVHTVEKDTLILKQWTMEK